MPKLEVEIWDAFQFYISTIITAVHRKRYDLIRNFNSI